MIPPPAQRAMSERAGSTVVDASGSHAVYVSKPEAVADLIKQAASSVTSRRPRRSQPSTAIAYIARTPPNANRTGRGRAPDKTDEAPGNRRWRGPTSASSKGVAD